MPERWRGALDALGRAHPDQARLRELVSRAQRTPEPEPRRGRQRLAAGALALAIGAASVVFVWYAFRGGPPSTDTATGSATPEPVGLDPAAVCDVPTFDPDVVLLVGSETVEYPKAVLDGPGASASAVTRPAADALRAYLDSPDARNAPLDGWREIAATSGVPTYAAPYDPGSGRWWVVGFELGGGVWRRIDEEIAEQRETPAQRGQGLRLAWSGELVLEGGAWSSTLELVNDPTSAWTDDEMEHWGLAHVFDRNTGREIGGGSHAIAGEGTGYDVPPGGHAQLPVALGGVGTWLPIGWYDVVACVPELGLASPVGTLRVVDGPAAVDVRVLTYRPTGESTFMTALGGGILTVHNGCLAVAEQPDDPRPIYVIWPDGYALVQRDGRAVLIDPVGREVGALGDDVVLGGGYVTLDHIEGITIGGVPAACRVGGEGYFLTSGPA